MKNKKCVILIDGVDGVGKSTVCQLLAEKTGFPIVKMPHMSKHFKSNPEEMSRMFNETIIQFPYDMILDRGYPSSLVYSKVYNRDMTDVDYISDISSKLKAKIFILTASFNDLLSRKKFDNLIDNDKRIELNKEYVEFGRFMGWTVIDTSTLEPQYVCKEILNRLKNI